MDAQGTMSRTSSWTTVAAAALALLACEPKEQAQGDGGGPEGSGGTGGSAGACTFAPCGGGNLVGAWRLFGGCQLIPPGTPLPGTFCPEATLTDGEITGSQIITLSADGAFTSAGGVADRARTYVPPSCVAPGQPTCAGVMAALMAQLGLYSAICTGSSEAGCLCNLEELPVLAQGSGTYAVEGDTLTVSVAPGVQESYRYCVRESSLTLRGSAGAVTTFTRQ